MVLGAALIERRGKCDRSGSGRRGIGDVGAHLDDKASHIGPNDGGIAGWEDTEIALKIVDWVHGNGLGFDENVIRTGLGRGAVHDRQWTSLLREDCCLVLPSHGCLTDSSELGRRFGGEGARQIGKSVHSVFGDGARILTTVPYQVPYPVRT